MACLSVLLGHAEYDWMKNHDAHRQKGFHFGNVRGAICWMRYVDDVLAVSHLLCGDCLLEFVSAAYPVALSVVSGAGDTVGKPHVWADVVVVPCADGNISILPKNPNRDWLHGKSVKERESFVRWLGRPSQPFGILRGILIGRLHRVRKLGLSLEWQTYRLVEDLCELSLVGYPLPFLRKLVHALPASPAALALRRFLRSWGGAMKERMGKQGPYKQQGVPLPVDRRDGGHGDRGRDSKRKSSTRRQRSTSSSSSSAELRAKVEKAQRILMKHDPAYHVYVDTQEKNKVKAQAVAQADAFKDALMGAFGALTPPPFPPPLGAAVVTPSTAASSSGVAATPPPGPVGPAAGPAVPHVVVDPNVITATQARLLESEFHHAFAITNLSLAGVKDTIWPHLKPPKNLTLLTSFVVRHNAGIVPRTQRDRVDLVVSTIQRV